MLLRSISFIAVFVSSGWAFSSELQDELFSMVLAGANCKQTINNGLICDYAVGKSLRLSIKDAGGSDQVVGFGHSDINDDLYAVLYFGCIAIVTGMRNSAGNDKSVAVYISPKNGQVYKDLKACKDITQ